MIKAPENVKIVRPDAIIIGTGMAALTTAVLLAKEGLRIQLLEQNWLPGGCSSSYPRKHFIFESGATTLVGLDPGMPLHYLLDQTGIEIPAIKLKIPMKIYLRDGRVLTRWENLDDWIQEAKQCFSGRNQEAFWRFNFKLSHFVWKTSISQRRFPPSSINDLLYCAKNTTLEQLGSVKHAFLPIYTVLKKYGLEQDQLFREFIDQQLLITAQNYAPQVNALFGATALCYTNYGNYYVPGGMIEMINPMIRYLEERGSGIVYREAVQAVEKKGKVYEVKTKNHSFQVPFVVSGIPINNTLPLFNAKLEGRFRKKVLDHTTLKGAFSMGLVYKKHREYDCIHHQIHLAEPLPGINAKSIFLSLSHPEDKQRCGPDEVVASVSTHMDLDMETRPDKDKIEAAIISVLEEKGFLKKENIIFHHASTPGAWEKWTARKFGFVGGYPQLMRIKPWQMIDARLDKAGAYICGDSTYPGQGIPGTCLSGIITYEKLKSDYL